METQQFRRAVWAGVWAVMLGCTSDAAQPPGTAADASSPGAGDAGDPLDPAGDAGGTDPAADGGPTPQPSCAGMSDISGNSVETVTVAGTPRQYRLHVPDAYDPTRPTAVVLNFHGLTSNASQQELYSGMARKSDEEGFIVVHPEGIGASWNGGYCCGTASNTDVDDVGFVGAILDRLGETLCVDDRRVYATGMSNGGIMSHRLACDLSARIAAVAPVAGNDYTRSCAPSRAVPVMQFHGTADATVPYSGAETSIASWVSRNGCDPSPTVTFDQGSATCETYRGCEGQAEVTLCTIQGLGHVWPGAFGGGSDIAATEAMWPFFAAHRLP